MELEALVAGGRRVCLLCFERQAEHCHRSMVADALRHGAAPTIAHLQP
jgi:uncharacterized protein (DUF488 family)